MIPARVKALSPHAQSLLNDLHESWSRRSTTVGEQQKARLIQQIAEYREAAAVPSLVSLFYAKTGRLSALAAAAIDQIVAACSVLELADLDRAVRDVSDWRGTQVGARDLHTVSQGFVGTLGVLSFHGSGYVREAAVRALAASSSPQALSFLLIRLNDWVEPVRVAAKDAVVQHIQPSNAAVIVSCLPLLLRLREQRRGGHQELVDAMLGLLLRPEVRDALLNGLRTADRVTQRAVFGLISERAVIDLLDVLKGGIGSDDAVIRLTAARGLRGVLAGSDLQAVIEPLLRDRFMPLRREALYGFVEKLPEQAVVPLQEALFDKHPSIRDLARFYLRRLGEVEFLPVYREKLGGIGTTLSVAVAGVGETGAAEDARLLLPFLKHDEARVRLAALRAVGRLDGDHYDAEMLAALSDRSARVAKAAREIVVSRRFLLTPDRLWPIFQRQTTRHGRRATLSLIAELPWWESAPLLVWASGYEMEDVHDRALVFLGRWRRNYHRLSRRPTTAELATLREAMAANEHRLDADVREDVRSILTIAERDSV